MGGAQESSSSKVGPKGSNSSHKDNTSWVSQEEQTRAPVEVKEEEVIHRFLIS